MRFFFVSFFVYTLSFLFLTCCDPIPQSTLKKSTRIADYVSMVANYDEQYAPLNYKEELLGFNFKKWNQEIYNQIVAIDPHTEDPFNHRYYQILNMYVAKFGDAHTRLVHTENNTVPSFVQVALTGISGIRKGKNMLVTELSPSFGDMSDYPIQKGDEITHIDGLSLFEYIDKHLVPYKNLGFDQSNYTALMGRVFARNSLMSPIPKPGTDLTITYKRGSKKHTTQIPWVVMDLTDFEELKESYQDEETENNEDDGKQLEKMIRSVISAKNSKTKKREVFQLLDTSGKPFITHNKYELLYNASRLLGQSSWKDYLSHFDRSFQLPPTLGGFKYLGTAAEVDLSPSEKFKRNLSSHLINYPSDTDRAFPVYVRKAPLGESGELQPVGVIQIRTFSPAGRDFEAMTETLKEDIKWLRSQGCEKFIIDTMDNPGGALSLLMKTGLVFWGKDISEYKFPEIKLGVNESWKNSLLNCLNSGTPVEQELCRRLYKKFVTAEESRQRLTEPFGIDKLYPHTLKENDGLDGFEFTAENTVLLQSAMNASCGDIFPLMMKTNNLATLIGQRTMGAGGNVEMNLEILDNSHGDVRLTKSLIIGEKGWEKPLENHGVAPHKKVDVTQSVHTGYEAVYMHALAHLGKTKYNDMKRRHTQLDDVYEYNCREEIIALGN